MNQLKTSPPRMQGRSSLLTADGLVNLLLGIALLAFPRSLFEALGLPGTDGLYPTILGGVLVGIGIALVQEARRSTSGLSGLGLGGAVAINLSAGVVIALWLLLGDAGLPLRGRVVLWVLVAFLVGLSSLELVAHRRRS